MTSTFGVSVYLDTACVIFEDQDQTSNLKITEGKIVGEEVGLTSSEAISSSCLHSLRRLDAK